MAGAPRWQITQGPYPYIALMQEAQQATSKDLPLTDEDLYRYEKDAAITAKMAELEEALALRPDRVSRSCSV